MKRVTLSSFSVDNINYVTKLEADPGELTNITRLKETLFHEFGHAADPNLHRRFRSIVSKENYADIWAIKKLLKTGDLEFGSLYI
ncbi:hypothetical protein [Candidatus Uabimicrobium sp. HlEnr_7]|uniref:hypothetical protein n=1 Tax=Candidatus Uabimicrobium helgolandensis TaxID=3095367 RepID=UPI0035588B96